MSPDSYKRKVANEITKFYREAPNSYVDIINKETKDIINKMGIGDKVHTLYEREAFLTVKDHKEDFRSCLSFHVINPAKMALGVISRVIIIQNVCDLLRVATQVYQWQGTDECITWFNNINDKNDLILIKYDICDF